MAMNLIPGIESTGGALSAEKIRLEIIAQNIANSNTTQDAAGNVYKRKEVAFEEYVKMPEREFLATLTKIYTKAYESLAFLMIRLPGE